MTELKFDRSNLRLILGIILSLIAMALLVLLVDIQQVLTSLRQINLVIIIPFLLLLMTSLITRAGAWRFILKERISLKKSFFIINAGYFVNSVLPFRIGEITRAYLLLPSGFEFWEALPSILLERLIDIGFTLSLFFIGLPFAIGFSQSPKFAYLFTGMIITGIILIYVLIKNRESVINWFTQTSIFQPKLRNRLLKITKAILSSLEILTDPVQLIKVFILMLSSWLIALANQFLLLKAFLPEAKFIWVVFTLGALGLGVSIPSSPGNIGLYEASITIALVAFGVDHEIALAYAIASHILSLLITTLLGSFGLVREGFALRDIWRLRAEHKKEIGL